MRQKPNNPSAALEVKSLSEGSAIGECSGSYTSTSAPLPESLVLSVEGSSLTALDLSQNELDDLVTPLEGSTDEMNSRYHNLDDTERKEQRLPFQIFPEPVEIILSSETLMNNLEQEHGKERLPSIVVEPTEVSEVESGELRWPPENVYMEDDEEEEEEDLFLEQCIPPANIADWGDEDEEDEGDEETSVILQQQQGLTLIDIQSDAFRDDTPTLPPSSAPTFN